MVAAHAEDDEQEIVPNDGTAVDHEADGSFSSLEVDDEDEDEESSSSTTSSDDDEGWIIDALRSSWRQHCLAVLVAVAAAWIAVRHRRQRLPLSARQQQPGAAARAVPAPQTDAGRRQRPRAAALERHAPTPYFVVEDAAAADEFQKRRNDENKPL